MPRLGTVLTSATGPLASACPRHTRSTRRHKVLSAKERAPTPNSAIGERRKEPSPVPDMAGDRKKQGGKKLIPIRCCCTSLLRCRCTSQRLSRPAGSVVTNSCSIDLYMNFLHTTAVRAAVRMVRPLPQHEDSNVRMHLVHTHADLTFVCSCLRLYEVFKL